MEEARKGAALRTKQETVVAGLQALIVRNAFEDLRKLAGKVEMDIDLNISRGRNEPFREVEIVEPIAERRVNPRR